MKPVNWTLEYVKDPCFIMLKANMSIARYSHSCVYDEKRGRIYVCGGNGDENCSAAAEDFDKPSSFL